MRLKRVICLSVVLCLILNCGVFAANFFDVQSGNKYYEAVENLSSNGIISGYEDGTFRPHGYVTRAEAVTMIVRAMGIAPSSSYSPYWDLPQEHWARSNIMTATEAGIVSGDGNGAFLPDGQVTYNQIVKMAVCALGLDNEAKNSGGWPDGYINVAVRNKIINLDFYEENFYYGKDESPATRGDVALIINNTYKALGKNMITVNGKKLSLGMSGSFLDTAEEVLYSTGGFTWYVYGTKTYRDFYAVGLDNNNKIVAIASVGEGFSYQGYKAGDVPNDNSLKSLYTDKNDSGKIHGALIIHSDYTILGRNKVYTKEQLVNEGKMNFHFTNAFRVLHGKNILKWDELAQKSAQLHSEDMADNDYFSHTGLNGSNPGSRMTNQGIRWTGCGENISAGTGHFLGFHSYDSWVNSSGHRENMLSDFTHLGVGMAYNGDACYLNYHTQNFVKY